MRPEILNRLFANVTTLPGIGSKLNKLLAKLFFGVEGSHDREARVADLLFHLPSGLIDRRHQSKLADLPVEGMVTVEVVIGRHRPPPPHNRRVPYRVDCFDDTGNLSLTFFHVHGDYLKRTLPEGETRFISGRLERYQGQPQMVHPDHMVSREEFGKLPLLEPVYPLTSGLSSKVLGKAIRHALDHIPELPEWQDPAWRKQRGFPGFGESLNILHIPEQPDVLAEDSPARQRLAYDELLANQLALSLMRRHMKKAAGRRVSGSGAIRQCVVDELPFSLTPSQTAALADIYSDMSAPERMVRLLQGDVGSGKTVVALLAILNAVEAGYQAALMVPTDILSRQHAATITRLLHHTDCKVDLLTGRERGREREEILQRIAGGQSNIIIGTHALFQEGVSFGDLALVVVDEQHRFGVQQRLALQAKAGEVTDVLVMTATPIPRTLTLTLYGDMDVSRLTEKPAGRQPVDTRVLPEAKYRQVADGVGRAMEAGSRVYWVCPLVEENEELNLTAVEQRFQQLNERFPGRVGLIHGRMSGQDKDAVMRQFQAGELALLVATTVIEVGVDVPDATVMVIENAEQFGLAQLHQLRGRIGRGEQSSTCILMYKDPLSETARRRLTIMRETEDGFVIAEEDLRLRGSGELLGTRQSGVPEFRLANLIAHADLLQVARDDVDMMLQRDPNLQSPRGKSLVALLHLFERAEAVRYISSG